MAEKHPEKVQPIAGGKTPAPDVMLGMWAGWMNQISALTPAAMDFSRPWGEMASAASASGTLKGGVKQLQETLSKDPTLRSIDEMWNANPLREVVPIDWAEISRALRTVWLRSLAKPEAAKTFIDLNRNMWQSALDAWQETGQRWMGISEPSKAEGPASALADKRFAAPEWQTNPAYRLLKEVYLLASDWLLEQGGADDMDEAERRRINFHLRQFVDAMSPTLMLLSNPAALRRAIETGGGSVAAGARNLIADLSAGKLSMVDADAYAPGRNLALTPGKVGRHEDLTLS